MGGDCDIPKELRKPCTETGNLSEEECIRNGCCYRTDAEPKCFKSPAGDQVAKAD